MSEDYALEKFIALVFHLIPNRLDRRHVLSLMTKVAAAMHLGVLVIYNSKSGGHDAGMARKLRVEYPGAIYHLVSRGDHREPIFKDDSDRDSGSISG